MECWNNCRNKPGLMFGSPEVVVGVGEGSYVSILSYTTPRPPPRKSHHPPPSVTSSDVLTPENLFTSSPLNRQLTCARNSNRQLRNTLVSAEDENMRLLSTIILLETEIDGMRLAKQLRKRYWAVRGPVLLMSVSKVTTRMWDVWCPEKRDDDLRKELFENSEILRIARETEKSPTKQRLYEKVNSLKRDIINKGDKLGRVIRELNETKDKIISLEKQANCTREELKYKEMQIEMFNQRMVDAEDEHEAEITRYSLELDVQKGEAKKWKDIADEYQSAVHQKHRENKILLDKICGVGQSHLDEVVALINETNEAFILNNMFSYQGSGVTRGHNLCHTESGKEVEVMESINEANSHKVNVEQELIEEVEGNGLDDWVIVGNDFATPFNPASEGLLSRPRPRRFSSQGLRFL